MPIKFACSCGAQYTAKDDRAGRTITCQKCHATVTVPNPADPEPAASGPDEWDFGADSSAAADDAETIPLALPPKVSSKTVEKKRAKAEATASKPASPHTGMSLEERIAARADEEAEREKKSWGSFFSRLNVGGGFLLGLIGAFLFGVALIVSAFFLPSYFKERYSDPKFAPDGGGDALLFSIHRSFGTIGIGLLIAGLGVAVLVSGYFAARRWGHWNYEADDDD